VITFSGHIGNSRERACLLFRSFHGWRFVTVLLLGVVTNIAIVFACSLTSSEFFGNDHYLPEQIAQRQFRTFAAQRTIRRIEELPSAPREVYERMAAQLDGYSVDLSHIFVSAYDFGWPFYSFRCKVWYCQGSSLFLYRREYSFDPPRESNWYPVISVDGGFLLTKHPPIDLYNALKVIPFSPRFLGLFGNSVIFAIFWSGLFWIVSTIRNPFNRKHSRRDSNGVTQANICYPLISMFGAITAHALGILTTLIIALWISLTVPELLGSLYVLRDESSNHCSYSFGAKRTIRRIANLSSTSAAILDRKKELGNEGTTWSDFLEVVEDRGWPLYSFTASACYGWEDDHIPFDESILVLISVDGGITIDRSLFGVGGRPMIYPVRPRWFGLVIDSEIFAITWWIVLFSPAVIRRARRRKHCWCVRCGYDLRDNFDAGCPECGWNRPENEGKTDESEQMD